VMLVTKFLQLLQEPVIPIMDYDRKLKKLSQKHSICNFRPNTQSLLELAVSFFDYYFNFEFETYQISITSAGLQWKHSEDYNLNHSDQSTMLIEDPSSKNENVTRCLKPHNLKIMRSEFFRAYKCTKNANWDLLFKPYNQKGERSIFEIYPPINKREEAIKYEIEDAMNMEQECMMMINMEQINIIKVQNIEKNQNQKQNQNMLKKNRIFIIIYELMIFQYL